MSARRENAFEKLRQQEQCNHEFPEPTRVQTSHGPMWRTECSKCGRYMSRSDERQLLVEMEAMKK